MVEKAMVDDGIILIKYFLNVSLEEQTRRLESRIDDPRKVWKLSADGPEVLPPPLRLPAGPRRDVRRDQHGVGAVAHRGQRRQEARSAEHHLPPAEPDSLQAASEARTARCRSRPAPAGTSSRSPRARTSRRRSRGAQRARPLAARLTAGRRHDRVPRPRRTVLPRRPRWYALAPDEVSERLGVDPATGLPAAKVAELAEDERAERAAGRAAGAGLAAVPGPVPRATCRSSWSRRRSPRS